MAGLVAGARLRELGVEVALVEKWTRPGGSMLLSSGSLRIFFDNGLVATVMALGIAFLLLPLASRLWSRRRAAVGSA